uniref:Uncharacterized protein n=1 Tax=Echeneis naucrates TaxID=173247 RepID=A0A665VDB5_ECHNA
MFLFCHRLGTTLGSVILSVISPVRGFPCGEMCVSDWLCVCDSFPASAERVEERIIMGIHTDTRLHSEPIKCFNECTHTDTDKFDINQKQHLITKQTPQDTRHGSTATCQQRLRPLSFDQASNIMSNIYFSLFPNSICLAASFMPCCILFAICQIITHCLKNFQACTSKKKNFGSWTGGVGAWREKTQSGFHRLLCY